MAEVIIMPKLGFNMSEGKLVRWYKQEGEPSMAYSEKNSSRKGIRWKSHFPSRSSVPPMKTSTL